MKDSENSIFIDGKRQIIEMLRFMPEAEREKLLENLKLRNPTMARELQEKSFSFNSLFALPKDLLTLVLRRSNPTVVGLALYLTSVENQKMALSLMVRTEAEKAFQIMNTSLDSKKAECEKAQKRLVEMAVQLTKKLNN